MYSVAQVVTERVLGPKIRADPDWNKVHVWWESSIQRREASRRERVLAAEKPLPPVMADLPDVSPAE